MKEPCKLTLLMLAALQDAVESIDLLAPISDFSARDDDGDTALSLAAHHRREAAFLRLLPRSDPLSQNDEGRTPFEVAVSHEMWRAVDAAALRVSREDAQSAFDRAGPAKMPGWASLLESESLASALSAAPPPLGSASAGSDAAASTPASPAKSQRRL